MKRKLSDQLLPYCVLGIAIALLIGVCIILSYILLWGLLIGAILWGIAHIKLYFDKKTKLSSPHQGRIIDYYEKNKKD